MAPLAVRIIYVHSYVIHAVIPFIGGAHRGHHRGETHVNGRPNRELRERRTANCEMFRENSIHLVRRPLGVEKMTVYGTY